MAEAPQRVLGLPAAESRERARGLLDRVGMLDKADEHPARLSGGQKQRVAIARALAMEPRVMLLDEPTSALDPELHAEVLTVLGELAGAGMTMVLVTHEVGFARSVANEVLFVDEGRVAERAVPEKFFDDPQHPRTRAFLRLVDR